MLDAAAAGIEELRPQGSAGSRLLPKRATLGAPFGP